MQPRNEHCWFDVEKAESETWSSISSIGLRGEERGRRKMPSPEEKNQARMGSCCREAV